MPIIRIDLLKGRSIEQKRAMAQEITQSVARIAKTDKKNIKIVFSDMEFEDYSDGGVLKKDEINEQK